jgi:L-asparaginase
LSGTANLLVCLVVLIMLFASITIAALAAVAETAPTAHRIQPRQNATTASERLGLQWLGGNSSLPKIL